MLSNVVEKAQVKVEELNFMRRKNVLKYDEVMNEQRRVIYDQRQRILMGEDFGEQVREMVAELVEASVRGALEGEQYSEDWDLDSLFIGLKQIYSPELKKSDIDVDGATVDEIVDLAVDDALEQYDERERVIGAEQMRSVERAVMLQVIDGRWKDHLLDMDYLQEGIHLRALGQRRPAGRVQGRGLRPVQRHARERQDEHGHDADEEQSRGPGDVHRHHPRRARGGAQLHERRRPDQPDVVHRRRHGRRRVPGRRRLADRPLPNVAAGGGGRGATTTSTATVQVQQRVVYDKVGRNDPCPCGSGKKYKKCHGA